MLGNSLSALLCALLCSAFFVAHAVDDLSYCPPSDNCLLAVTGLKKASCTSQDIVLGEVVACSSSGDCSGDTTVYCNDGDDTPFNFQFTIITKGATRYDVGVFVGRGAQDDARSGNCCTFVMDPDPPHTDLDGDNCGDALPYTTYTQTVQVTLKCSAATGTNNLAFPYCTAWSQTDYTCTGASALQPGTGSKCFCDTVTVSNVVVQQPSIFWDNGPLCYTANTVMPLYIPFHVTNSASSPATISLTPSPAGLPIYCCTPSGCARPSTPYVPVSVSAGATLYCWLQFSGSSATYDEFYITATSTFASGFTTTDTSAAWVIKRVGIAINSFNLAFTSSGAGSTDGSLSYTVVVQNTGYDATVQSLTSPLVFSDCASDFDLAAGATRTCTATETITAGTATPPYDCEASRTVTAGISLGSCQISAMSTATTSLTNRVCRPVNGDCDLEEVCPDGTGSTCPSNDYDPDNDCSDSISCTDDVCTLIGNEYTCTHTTNNANCDTCQCAPGICVSSADVDFASRWSDDCVHKYGNVVIPPNSGGSCTGTP